MMRLKKLSVGGILFFAALAVFNPFTALAGDIIFPYFGGLSDKDNPLLPCTGIYPIQLNTKTFTPFTLTLFVMIKIYSLANNKVNYLPSTQGMK